MLRSWTLSSIWFFMCNPQIHMCTNYIGYLKLFLGKTVPGHSAGTQCRDAVPDPGFYRDLQGEDEVG